MEQDKMKTWLVSIGIPQDRSMIIADNFKKSCGLAVNSLSLDDLEILAQELFTKYNFK